MFMQQTMQCQYYDVLKILPRGERKRAEKRGQSRYKGLTLSVKIFPQWIFIISRPFLTRQFFMSKIPHLSRFEVQTAQVDFLGESHKEGPNKPLQCIVGTECRDSVEDLSGPQKMYVEF
jgi:hypothetical protein